MGFSVKIAPGVRVRASSRGFSAGVGPRAARVHVGSRGVGLSSGVGPVSVYTHLGSGATKRSSAGRAAAAGYAYAGPSRTTLAALEREARRAEKEEQIASIERIERALVAAHRTWFPPAAPRYALPAEEPDLVAIRARFLEQCGVDALVEQVGDGGHPPTAAEPEPVELKPLRQAARREALAGIGIFRVGDRRRARRQAEAIAAERAEAERARREEVRRRSQDALDAEWAELCKRRADAERLTAEEVARLRADAERRRVQDQAALDAQWEALVANDPPTVIAALEQAFADNGAPATPLDCDGATATVTVLYGHPDLIPERAPALTPSGRPTLRKRTKADRNRFYLQSLASNVLATVKEGFAVAPGLDAITALVVRREPTVAGERLAAIYAGTFTRAALEDAPWSSLDPAEWLMRPRDCCVAFKGQAQEPVPLDLGDEPSFRSVVDELAAALGIQALKTRPRR